MGSGFASRLVSDMARLGHRWGTIALLLAASVIALVVSLIPAYAGGGCATPGRDGVAHTQRRHQHLLPGQRHRRGGVDEHRIG
jgi:hypothetical protein